MLLEPIYETDFSPWSYGFRPNRRTHDAIMAAYTAMSESAKMYWVIDADIEGFFDNVDHQRLEQVLQDRISDQSVRDLIWGFLKAGVMEEGTHRHSMLGTPQGGIVSPLLANIYLNDLDQWAKRFTDRSRLQRKRARNRGKGNWRYVRYADDFLLLTNGRRKCAERMVERLQEQVRDRLNLTLSRKKTKIVHANDGLEFLGYRLKRKRDGDGGKATRLLIPEEAKTRFREKVKAATGGSHDVSARAKIRALNAVVRGWGTYYKYAADAPRAFSDLDNFVWWQLMGWLTKKYRISVRKVIERRLENRSPPAVNGKSLAELYPMGSALYTGRYRKNEHPYLKGTVSKREKLPEVDPWLANLKERPGWEDQRWKALGRDNWTCQKCGKTLSKTNAEVHHEQSSAGYKNRTEAHRLGNLTSLCEGCHKEVESNRSYVK
jgi:group II intron reverse transcriptase/maturase